MKILARRFALVAVLGSLLCGALVAGCSSGEEPTEGNTAAPKEKAEE